MTRLAPHRTPMLCSRSTTQNAARRGRRCAAVKLWDIDSPTVAHTQRGVNLPTAAHSCIGGGTVTTLSVKTTYSSFIEWLNSYGEANQPDFKPSGKSSKALGPDTPLTIHHLVTTQHGIAGFIIVDIWPREAERLEVTLTAMREINVVGRLTPGKPNPYATQLDAHLEQLVKAIKKRWPQRHKPGRPRYQCHEWAWEQVNALGKKPNEIRDEWARRYDEETGGGFVYLQDPERNFRYAIDPGRKKNGRN